MPEGPRRCSADIPLPIPVPQCPAPISLSWQALPHLAATRSCASWASPGTPPWRITDERRARPVKASLQKAPNPPPATQTWVNPSRFRVRHRRWLPRPYLREQMATGRTDTLEPDGHPRFASMSCRACSTSHILFVTYFAPIYCVRSALTPAPPIPKINCNSLGRCLPPALETRWCHA